MFELKTYQQQTLAALQTYLEEARLSGPAAAFQQIAAGPRQPYRAIPQLEDAPYVCLRLPTGGGKTLLAAHSIAIAGQAFLERDFPFVLWLVPTNAIRQQTLDTLQDPAHPNRQALEAVFGSQVRALDIVDFADLRPADVRDRLCIVVGTLAALRVNSTEGRKVYAHHEAFEPHFSQVPANAPYMERIEDGPDQGQIKFSFRNLLARLRPLVIVDEAHNATSDLSFEVLQRIRPACVLEFTATPAANSNILYRVSAAQLKAEEMIKLPIVLTEHKTWQEAVHDAIATRQKLHELAANEANFIHPLVLFQAEDKGHEITVDVIRQYLLEAERIAPERIAIATGAQKELDGVNLLDPANTVEFVITIEALKEGWDCPFAYVFCSVATVHSKKDVEQILGRVLRMPYARRRAQEALNRAYAHVSSTSWPRAVTQLQDRLVSMGFEEPEAETAILPQPTPLPGFEGLPLGGAPAAPVISFTLSAEPGLIYLSAEERQQVTVHKLGEGQAVFEVKGEISPGLAHKLVEAAPKKDQEALRQALAAARPQRPPSPSESGVPFRIPQLCLWVDRQLERAEREWFLDAGGWNLLDFPARLSAGEFNIVEQSESFLIDLNGKRLETRYLGAQTALDFKEVNTGWTDLQLSRWLDQKLYQPDVRQETLLEFIRRTLVDLMETRKFSLPTLVRGRFLLERALRVKIVEYRQQAYQQGYQHTLFGGGATVQTSYEYTFAYDPNQYPAHWYYQGSYKFNKHYYPVPGELEAEGEEFDCAQALDRCFQVKHWVRNLAGQAQYSFYLPTATDKFYPDFVAELKDGRILVVEYKGAHLLEAAKQDRNLGELWEEKSGSQGLFLMAVKKDALGRDVYKQIEDKVG